MKKFVSLLLASTMSISLLASCSSTPTDTGTAPEVDENKEENVSTDAGSSELADEITVYVHTTQLILGDEKLDDKGNTYRDESTAWLKFAGEDFTKETGIAVNFVPISSNYEELKPALKAGDSSFDVISYAGGGFSLEEMEAYLAPVMTVDEAKTMYEDAHVNALQKIGNDVYVWSMSKVYNNGIAYNENVIKSVGYDEIPGTLEEFEVMLGKIRDSGVTPIALHRVENWPLDSITGFSDYVYGEPASFATMLKYDEPFSDNGSPVGKMLKIYTNFKSQKFFEQEIYADFGVPMDKVAYGEAGMMLFGAWVVPQIKSRVPDGDGSIIKFDAAVDYGAGRFVSVDLGDHWVINKSSTKQEEGKMFLDYVSKRADVIAKNGGIDARTDVDAIVPEQYQLIDTKIENGTVSPIYPIARNANWYNNEEILKEIDLLADVQWAGLPFDAYDVTKPGDWTAYDAQIDRQNKAYKSEQEALGYEFEE